MQGKAKVRTMTVLFSELLVPGWSEGDDAMIGLDAVTGVYGTDRAFTLPCLLLVRWWSSSVTSPLMAKSQQGIGGERPTTWPWCSGPLAPSRQ